MKDMMEDKDMDETMGEDMPYKMPLKLNLKKGALHKTLGISMMKKIPHDDLEKALGSRNALTRKRANFAKVAATWNHKR